ncbi:MAG TPA: molybdate ABC transporter substrate-binding protein [Pyrinomonadaceae bacterium]|jgi:molybdate transport system substrate-binding protein|nr:molybdate ABC transporter substrate-binding protein [Pyrinomonadaceae bacterium]
MKDESLKGKPERRKSESIKRTCFFSSFIIHPSYLLFILPTFAFMLAFGCAGRGPSPGSVGQPELNVAAAANLSDAFTELGQQFTKETGIRVVYSFGATADLSKQIENGAPFDLFAAADVSHVDALNRAGLLVPGTKALYARGRLVLWVPQDSRLTLSRVEDVTRRDVERIAVAKPDVAPYGLAAVEALRALNIWSSVEPKVIYGQNVSQVKQYAATGNADVAFIPLSLVHKDEGHVIEVDAHLHQPIDQAIAIVKTSTRQPASQRFLTFVLSPTGQTLLQRYGYEKAGTTSSDK